MTSDDFIDHLLWSHYLGRNLAIAGWLCQSFTLGTKMWCHGPTYDWHPGCALEPVIDPLNDPEASLP